MGAEGGGEGGRGRMLRNAGTPNEEALPSKVVHMVLAAGETFRIETPGGAGLGSADERPLDVLAADLRDGIMSIAAAERAYGVERTRLALACKETLSPAENRQR
jgi:N-methylhydantoinase B